MWNKFWSLFHYLVPLLERGWTWSLASKPFTCIQQLLDLVCGAVIAYCSPPFGPLMAQLACHFGCSSSVVTVQCNCCGDKTLSRGILISTWDEHGTMDVRPDDVEIGSAGSEQIWGWSAESPPLLAFPDTLPIATQLEVRDSVVRPSTKIQ